MLRLGRFNKQGRDRYPSDGAIVELRGEKQTTLIGPGGKETVSEKFKLKEQRLTNKDWEDEDKEWSVSLIDSCKS